MTEVSLSELKGKEIYTTDGLEVGTVLRFELDTVLWKVRSLVVNVSDTAMEVLEVKKSIMRPSEILIGKELIKRVGDVINLNVSMSVLKSQLAGPTSKRKVIADD